MGKLSVFLFLTFGSYAVFGAVTNRNGYGRTGGLVPGEEFADYNVVGTRGTDVECNFDQELDSVRGFVEMLVYQYNLESEDAINISNQLNNVIGDTSKSTSTKTAARTTELLKTLLTALGHETAIGNATIIAIQKLLNDLNTRLSVCQQHTVDFFGQSHNKLSIYETVERVQVLLDQVKLDDISTKYVFDHVLDNYLENLQKSHIDIESLTSLDNHSILNFIKNVASSTNRMSYQTSLAFLKATVIFENRLNTLSRISTPTRYLIYRIYALTGFLTNAVEFLADDSPAIEEGLATATQKYVELLRHVVLKLKTTTPQLTILREIITELENDYSGQTLIKTIHLASSEMHKLLMVHPEENGVVFAAANDFLNALLVIQKVIVNTAQYVEDVNQWSVYVFAYSNKPSMYLKGELANVHFKQLYTYIGQSLEILQKHDSGVYKHIIDNLETLTQNFSEGQIEVNNYLETVSVKLNELLWSDFKDKREVSIHVKGILTNFIEIVQNLHMDYEVIRGLESVQTLPEIAMVMQDVADRLNKLFHVRVPGFDHPELVQRLYTFEQMLESAMFGICQVAMAYKSENPIFEEVYTNLNQLRENLRDSAAHRNFDINVKVSVYIQDAVVELKKLALVTSEERIDLVPVFGDFLFGLNEFQNQIQFDFEIISRSHDAKSLNMQIQAITGSLRASLSRAHLKPQLRNALFNQLELFLTLGKDIQKTFKVLATKYKNVPDLVTKYQEIHDKLVGYLNSGEDVPMSDLSVSLQTFVNTVIADFQNFVYLEQNDTMEFRELSRHALVVFSNSMVRMQNVFYYEYFHSMQSNTDMIEDVHRTSLLISEKLQNVHESEEVNHDLAIHAFRYAHRLEKVAERLQIEAGVDSKPIVDIILRLQNLGRGQIPPEGIKVCFANNVVSSATEVAKLLKQESLVGATHALIKHSVAVDKLNMHLEHILMTKSGQPTTLHRMTSNVDSHVHYLSKVLEQVIADDNNSLGVLQNLQNQTFSFINRIFAKLPNLEISYKHFLQITNERIPNVSELDNIRMTTNVYAQKIAVVFKQLVWKYETNPEVKVVSDTAKQLALLCEEFLAMVQNMQIQVESDILIQQDIDRRLQVSRFNRGIFYQVTNSYLSNDYRTQNQRNKFPEPTNY